MHETVQVIDHSHAGRLPPRYIAVRRHACELQLLKLELALTKLDMFNSIQTPPRRITTITIIHQYRENVDTHDAQCPRTT